MSGFEVAKLTPRTGPAKGKGIPVHFNPVSLQYTVANTLQEQGKEKKQFVTKSTAKLTMDLVFDTTHSGEDVRITTEKVAALMEPDEKKIPIVVDFEWGVYLFRGMVESYKETIDFFAPNGVPLRAAVNLTLSKQDKVFEASPHPPADKADTGSTASLNNPVVIPSGGSTDATSAAAQGGNPRAGRSLAAANGAESMRFLTGASLTVSGGIQLGAPVAFATGVSAGAGAGIGVGAGAGIGVSGGAGVGISGGLGVSAGASAGFGASAGASAGFGASAGASAGFGASAGASAGIGLSAGASAGFGLSASAIGGAVFGSTASAGVSATAGAFSGLRVSASASAQTAGLSLDTSRFLPPSGTASYSLSGATFGVGGQAAAQSSAGLRADVGATASLKGRIQF
jgi:hypothetical protein